MPDGHTISVVVPVYLGERTLEALLLELMELTSPKLTPGGRTYCIAEVILVHDCGPDRSAEVIRRLSEQYEFIRPVWLSRNFGQHAATIAGISSSGAQWVATIDEDGQFDPKDIALLLDTAVDRHAQLVYGTTDSKPPHARIRNSASALTKWLATKVLLDGALPQFSSFRLMLGEVGRSVAAYVGPDVYLDVALSWVFGSVSSVPVTFRATDGRTSGYSYRKLAAHFWRLLMSVAPRSLRLVSFSGFISATAGFAFALYILVEKISGHIKVAGWASLAVFVLLVGGAILFALGILIEYVGAAVRMAMGKPLYLVTSDPSQGPLGLPTPADVDPRP